VKPIPVVFHIGPLQVHTYGIGLAITFWFSYRYFAKRLRDHGYPDAWFARAFVWIIVASIVGARAVHVVANFGFYSHNLGDILAVWHGGLSSYGGLLLGVPAGLICARRWCPQLRLSVALDLVAPVLAIAWAVGRLLGPQLMYQGGGRQTTAWYGLAYAGQVGKRVPVPVFQAIEDALIFVIALVVERAISRRGGPVGVVLTVVITLYGATRFFDEHFLLPHGSGGVAVEGASIAFVAVGAILAVYLLWRDRGTIRQEGSDPWLAPVPAAASADEHEVGEGAASEDAADERGAGAGVVVGRPTGTNVPAGPTSDGDR